MRLLGGAAYRGAPYTKWLKIQVNPVLAKDRPEPLGRTFESRQAHFIFKELAEAFASAFLYVPCVYRIFHPAINSFHGARLVIRRYKTETNKPRWR